MLRSDPNDATKSIVLPSLPLETHEKLEEVDIPKESELLIPVLEDTEEGEGKKKKEVPSKSQTINESQNRSPPQPKIDHPLSKRFIDKALIISPPQPKIDRPISQRFTDKELIISPPQPKIDRPISQRFTDKALIISPPQLKFDRPISQRFNDEALVISPPQPKIDRPQSQNYIDEVLRINIMNLELVSSTDSSTDNNLDAKIYKLYCSTNKVLMVTNYKFDKKSKLFYVGVLWDLSLLFLCF